MSRRSTADWIREAAAFQARPAAEIAGPTDAALLFALGFESGGTEDLLSGPRQTVQGDGFTIHSGRLGERRVLVVRCGVGRAAAARAAEAVIRAHRPEVVISTGFAGGLSPALGRYDVMVVSEVIDVEGQLSAAFSGLPWPPSAQRGRLLTVDRVVSTAEEKRSLAERHAALAVDMETAAVAQVCEQWSVRWLGVRVISDTVEDELPADLDRLVRQKTGAGRLGAAVGALWNRPSTLKDMLRLKEYALVASDRLAKYLETALAGLPPTTELPTTELPTSGPPAIENDS